MYVSIVNRVSFNWCFGRKDTKTSVKSDTFLSRNLVF